MFRAGHSLPLTEKGCGVLCLSLSRRPGGSFRAVSDMIKARGGRETCRQVCGGRPEGPGGGAAAADGSAGPL